jgi:hypothetical protein
MEILKGRREQRALHWREISKKVRTHEGQLLTGNKGAKYQEKYSQKYLGRDISVDRLKINAQLVERFEKKK